MFRADALPAERGTGALRFRNASADDIAAMSEIRLSVQENVLSDPARVTHQMYLDYLDAPGHAWVCCDDGQILGFAYAIARDASIWALFVRPGHEGRGIGKELLRLAVNWLFEQGCQELHVSTTVDTRAERFYRAQGWTRGEMSGELEVRYRLRRPVGPGSTVATEPSQPG